MAPRASENAEASVWKLHGVIGGVSMNNEQAKPMAR